MNQGFIYAIVFNNGVTKFGMTKTPGARIPQIINSAKVMGVGYTDVLLSTNVENVAQVEARLLNMVSRTKNSKSKEYFENTSSTEAANFFEANGIPYVIMDKVSGTRSGDEVFLKGIVKANLSCFKTIQPNVTDLGVVEEKIMKFAKKGITLGVLKHRIKKVDEFTIVETLESMIDRGLLNVENISHPRKKTKTKKYTIT